MDQTKTRGLLALIRKDGMASLRQRQRAAEGTQEAQYAELLGIPSPSVGMTPDLLQEESPQTETQPPLKENRPSRLKRPPSE